MNKLIPTLIAGALGMTAFASVQAQDAPDATDPVATLEVKQGSVMRSSGGEFESANSGTRLIDGERIMVSEGAKAVIVYDNKCRDEYVDPGVYKVDNHGCVGAAYVANADVATVVAVAAVLAPLLIDDGDQDLTPPPAPPPVSQ